MPVGYSVPVGISYTVLEDLYIPEEDSVLIGVQSTSTAWDYVNELMYHAHDISGHPDRDLFIPHTGPYIEGGGGSSSHGTITAFDTRLNANVPIEGLKIKAVKHGGFGVLSHRTGVTNAEGQYTLDGLQTRGRTNYTIIYEMPQFGIYRNLVSTFFDIIGTSARSQFLNRDRSNFSHNFSTTGDEQYDNMIAHMFRAAFRYYYGDVDGLKRPTRPFGTRQRMLAVNGVKGWIGHNYIVFPSLRIERNASSTTFHDSDEYYSATLHELAHTAHVLTMNTVADYALVNLQIMESWATACEWHLTGLEYRARGIANYGQSDYFVNGLGFPNIYAYQYWNRSIHEDYTSLFINLVDDFNENGVNLRTLADPLFGTVDDRINGYTLGNIQNIFLKNIYGSGSLNSQLKANKPIGVTDANLDLLLVNY